MFLQQPGMELIRGDRQGYIADRVRDFLRQQQVEKALINLGGNVHTRRMGHWPEKPFADAQALIGSLTVNGQSVVTRDLRALFRTGWQTLAPYSRPERLSAGQRTRQRDGHFRGFFGRRTSGPRCCSARRRRAAQRCVSGRISTRFSLPKIATLFSHRFQQRRVLRRWTAAIGLLTVLLSKLYCSAIKVAIDRPPGSAVVDSGIENIDLRQPNQIFAAGNVEIFTAAASSSVENSTSGWASIHWQSAAFARLTL